MSGVLINGKLFECEGGNHFHTLTINLDKFYSGEDPDGFISTNVVFIYDSFAYTVDEDYTLTSCDENMSFLKDNHINTEHM